MVRRVLLVVVMVVGGGAVWGGEREMRPEEIVAAVPAETKAGMVRELVAGLPGVRKEGEKERVMWWGVTDESGDTAAVRVRRTGVDELTGELLVTGKEGGVYTFRGPMPAEGFSPKVTLAPGLDHSVAHTIYRYDAAGYRDTEEGSRAFSKKLPGTKGVRVWMLELVPATDGRVRLFGVAWRGVTEFGPAEAGKMEALAVPLLERRDKEDQVRAKARKLAALDYDTQDFGGEFPPGETVVYLVRGSREGSLWGAGPYSSDSNFAKAAVHAGALGVGELGIVRVKFIRGGAEYQGSERNGVTSAERSAGRKSVVIERVPVE